jgi:long-chain fatty acid transport protein
MIKSCSIVAGIVLALHAAPAHGQNTENYTAFDFSLPGARSRGIGGAFVAIADDATSVYSNPAGLVLLFRPEVSIEGRRLNLKNRVIDRGHAYGQPTNIGLDTVSGVVDGVFRSEIDGVSFFSFVYPKNRWSVGVFRHQLARSQVDQQIQGVFFNCRGGFRGDNPTPPYCDPDAIGDGVDRIAPAQQSFDLDIHSYGGAAAYKIADNLSAGVAVQFFRFELAGSNRVFQLRGDQKYEAADFSNPENVDLIATQSGKDTAVAINAGVMWDIAQRWAAGASFRQGPRFQFLAQTTTGPANRGLKGVTFVNIPDNPFKVPDTLAAGLAFRPSNQWRLSAEYDLVRFSQLTEDLRNTSTPQNDAEGLLLVERLRVNDAHQIRLGGEYLARFGGKVAAFRGGGWYDPAHQPFFEVDDAATGLPAPRWPLYFPKRKGDRHLSAGFGFSTRHFQLDAAADFSKLVDTFAISSLWRF